MLFSTLTGLVSYLTLYLLVSSADNFCKQFGPRSRPAKCRAWSGSKLFYTLMVKKNFLKQLILKKISRLQKEHEKIPRMQRVKQYLPIFHLFYLITFFLETLDFSKDLQEKN